LVVGNLSFYFWGTGWGARFYIVTQ
jgi:hypothetical protein